MMRSLFAGVSGLRNHQVRMDVIGNNIANVNTVAFKSSRVTFKEAFAQIVQGASRPPGADVDVAGGTNPIQVGLGMNIGSIDLLFTQGNLESTGVTTDLAIQGESFFVVSNGSQRFFTRSGNFQLDANGRLVAATNGFVVQGRMAVDGELRDSIGDIKLPFGQKSAAQATGSVLVGGNLRADSSPGASRQTSITVYDSQGTRHELTVTFTKPPVEQDEDGNVTNGNIWRYDIGGPGGAASTGSIAFGEDGTFQGRIDEGHEGDNFVRFGFLPPGFSTENPESMQWVNVNFGPVNSIDGLSQFSSPSTAVLREQDGYAMGNLERISIDQTGTITGAYSNGVTLTLAQVAVADFNNPTGLIRSGDNMYSISPNSGAAVLGFAGQGSQSIINSGALEMSNVDLAQEFTSMITAQRGFQSNARVITASDEMLQELVNLKR